MTRIANVEFNDAQREFVDSEREYISEADIESYAESILDAAEGEGEPATFIVKGLDESSLLAYMLRIGVIEWHNRQLVMEDADGMYVQIPRDEIFAALSRIRNAVHEKILNQLYSHPELDINPTDIALVERSRHLSGNIQELLTVDQSRSIHKRLVDASDHRVSRLAIQKLMHAPDYPTVRKPTHYDEETGETLMPEYTMSTLGAEWLEGPDDEMPPALNLTQSELIQVIVDCLRGAQFLLDQGLIIQDLHSSNIGVDSTTRSGFLFDFDQLIKTSQHPEEIYRPVGYVDSVGYVPSYEREVVAQFGGVIHEMIGNIEFPEPAASELRRLCADSADERVSCTQALRRLETIQDYVVA